MCPVPEFPASPGSVEVLGRALWVFPTLFLPVLRFELLLRTIAVTGLHISVGHRSLRHVGVVSYGHWLQVDWLTYCSDRTASCFHVVDFPRKACLDHMIVVDA